MTEVVGVLLDEKVVKESHLLLRLEPLGILSESYAKNLLTHDTYHHSGFLMITAIPHFCHRLKLFLLR